MPALDTALSQFKVVMVSKVHCPFCTRAKGILGNYKLKSYTILECDSVPEIQSRAQELSGQRTVPNIFIAGSSIGGCDSLTALHSSGKLKTMLEGAGAL